MAWGAETAFAVTEGNGVRQAHAGTLADCPELDCLVGRIDAVRLAAARRRAIALGTGADRVLIASGAISEFEYLRALADDTGIAVTRLVGLPRDACPFDDARIIDGAATGSLTIVENGVARLLIAPRGLLARRIVTIMRGKPDFAQFCRLATGDDFDRFVLRAAGTSLGERAAQALRQRRPRMSAAPPARRVTVMPITVAAAAVLITVAAAIVAPAASISFPAASLALFFALWLGLRMAAAVMPLRQPASASRLPDHALPDYTVICALYDEAASAGALLAAIARFDYPREKLQVIFALEPDDRETRAAIEARKGRLPVTIVTVPPGGPRTKPKALNAALPFARGRFTVIFDAEDRPEPGQLRAALQAFAEGGSKLACVQARLCIDNTADGWLPRVFTAEYAGQFDVFLLGLSAMDLPLPLGGSSNHFRTETLRKAGGWDAYNVTEDADLGVRFARLGYRVTTIASTTFEEAPARLRAWLHQRTRWFKGWMHPVNPMNFSNEIKYLSDSGAYLRRLSQRHRNRFSPLAAKQQLVFESAIQLSGDQTKQGVPRGFDGGVSRCTRRLPDRRRYRHRCWSRRRAAMA